MADYALDVQGLCVDIDTPAGALHAVRDVSFRSGRARPCAWWANRVAASP